MSVPGSFDNPIWIDVYTSNPLDTYDWLIPYMRPPDVPNNLGIGRDDLEHVAGCEHHRSADAAVMA